MGRLMRLKRGALDVVEDTKQEFLANFIEAGVPVVQAYADHFTDTVKAQAAAESGWCKIRDALVIPAAVKIGLYIGKQILTMVAGKTQGAAQTA